MGQVPFRDEMAESRTRCVWAAVSAPTWADDLRGGGMDLRDRRSVDHSLSPNRVGARWGAKARGRRLSVGLR